MEQVIHQIDLMNWVMGATPVSALGQGGRLKRTGPRWGNIYDHMELIQSIRDGAARSDMLDFAIDSTLTTIMGRESAYTGQAVTWDEISASGLDLFPTNYPNGAPPDRPVAIPGTSRPV